jgi:hypothetical protein
MWEPRCLTTLWVSMACYRGSFTSLPLLKNVLSIQTEGYQITEWLIKCKGFGRKCSWHNKGTIPKIAWRDWEKPRRASIRIACCPGRVSKENLKDTYLHALQLDQPVLYQCQCEMSDERVHSRVGRSSGLSAVVRKLQGKEPFEASRQGIKFMQWTPSWEANSCSATQEFSNILRNSKVHDNVYSSPPLGPILSQNNPVCTSPFYLSKIHFNIYSHGAYGWHPYRHLWVDCPEDAGPSTSHNPIGLHGLLQG